jgi:hypothetical protein
MINLFETIEALLATGSRILAIVSKAVGVVKMAQAEGRKPTKAELDSIRALDDESRNDLVKALERVNVLK